MKGKIGIVMALSLLMLAPLALGYGADSGQTTPPINMDPWEQCMQNAEKAYMFGTFSYDAVTGDVSGRFVEFHTSGDGMISDYTVKRSDSSIKVFDQVYLEAFTPQGTPRVEGAMFQYMGTEAMIMAHNNPPAVLHFTTMTGEDTVVYVLADGFTATKLPESYNVRIQGNGLTGYIINGKSNITIENNTVTVTLPAASQSLFRAMPVESVVGQMNQDKIMEKIREGKVIGEISVSAYSGEKSADIMKYQHQVQVQLQLAEQNKLQIKVSAEFQEGKCIVVNIDKETMKLSENQEIVVKLDGQKLRKESNIDNVLNANDAEGRYNIAEGTDGYQISVYIPHFSDHTLTVEPESSTSTGETAMPGFTGAVAIIGTLAAMGIAAAYRKRK